jgi:hypothetical protein
MLKIGGTCRRGACRTTCSSKVARAKPCAAELLRNHGCAHDPAPAHGHLLRPRREGQRALLREQGKQQDPHTKEVWIYDYRTNIKHTLKTNPLAFDDLKDFITCYNPADRHKRKATWSEKSPEGRWRKYTYADIIARDKASLDIFWLKDDSLEDSANLPEPGVLAASIVDDLEAALEQFRLIAEDLK